MKEFKVFPKTGFDYHFKMSMRAFDSSAFIEPLRLGGFYVKTTLAETEIAGFTSVEKVVDINPKKPLDLLSEGPLRLSTIINVIEDTLTRYALAGYSRKVMMDFKVYVRDLECKEPEAILRVETVLWWSREWPVSNTVIDYPILGIEDGKNGTFIMTYSSSKDLAYWGFNEFGPIISTP